MVCLRQGLFWSALGAITFGCTVTYGGRLFNNDCQPEHPLGNMTKILEDINCHAPPPGKSALVEYQEPKYHGYRLSQPQPNQFVAEVEYYFVPSEDLPKDSQIKDFDAFTKKYEEKVQACFDEIKPYLKGPNNETLTLKLSRSRLTNDGFEVVPLRRIEVMSKDYRPDPSGYPENISCAAIIHETLHVMGLADEYEENSIGIVKDPVSGYKVAEDINAPAVNAKEKYLAFDCRAKGPEDSIMNKHELAVILSAPHFEVSFPACTCKIPAKRCQQIYADKKTFWGHRTTCPPGFHNDEYFYEASKKDGAKDYLSHVADLTDDDPPAFVLSTTSVKLEEKPPVRNSLLLSAQFRMITKPFCNSQNKTYLDCTAESRKTSKEHLGTGCSEKVPSICTEKGFKWLN